VLISLTWQRALVFDVIAWVLIGAGSGYWQAKRPLAALRKMGPFTRMGAGEYRGERYRKWWRVHLWKDLIPDAGTWFGGLSKRKLPSVADGGRLRFIDECVRAERTHLALIGAIPLFIVWNSPAMFAGNVAFALVGNIPCWMIARYNRARLMNIAMKTSRLA
jgi:glycosyl-4,4'-diaponeurosporenoate acyltransferase